MKKNNGITLIALVITIIVMLILVAVTITIAGNGGLFEYAGKAAQDTEIAKQEERNWTNIDSDKNYDYLIAQYTKDENQEIDWEEVLANAAKHPSQSAENNDIGIGTDGKPVNLDLWTYDEEESLGDNVRVIGWRLGKEDKEEGILSGYQNTNIVDGKIQGCMPQYIKRGTGDFLPVLNLTSTFSECTNLVTAPKIPSNVKHMTGTFSGCSNLVTAPIIPDSVTYLDYTFYNCTSLTTVPNIPNSAFNMNSAFDGCTSLTSVPDLPNTVRKMNNTFMNCSSLTAAPKLSTTVIEMSCTFKGCTSITTVPDIPISAGQLDRTFSGCSSLTVVPNIWTRVTTDTTTYKGNPNGNGCFEGCTNASNYESIPNYWKIYSDPFRKTLRF